MKGPAKSNSQLNKSPSKQLYSFPKEHRFNQRTATQGTDRFYEIPNTNKHRAYCFSKAQRLTTQQRQGSVSPDASSYSLKGLSEINKDLKKGVSFATGRQQCKADKFIKASENPGPAAYHANPQYTLKRMRVGGSMGRLKSKSSIINKGSADTPGPGNYNINSTLLNQHKVLSKDHKKIVGRVIFVESKTARRKKEVFPPLRLPGLNRKGEKMSKLEKGYKLGKANRFKTTADESKPGPGAYECFSEFVD